MCINMYQNAEMCLIQKVTNTHTMSQIWCSKSPLPRSPAASRFPRRVRPSAGSSLGPAGSPSASASLPGATRRASAKKQWGIGAVGNAIGRTTGNVWWCCFETNMVVQGGDSVIQKHSFSWRLCSCGEICWPFVVLICPLTAAAGRKRVIPYYCLHSFSCFGCPGGQGISMDFSMLV